MPSLRLVAVAMNKVLKLCLLLATFAAAGLASAFAGRVRFASHLGVTFFLLMGALFGLSVTICLWIFFGLRSIWKSLAFVSVSAAACLVSVLVAAFTHQATRNMSWAGHVVLWHAYFAGGFAGAFIILAAAFLLLFPDLNIGWVLLKAVSGALVGGVLGIAGYSMRESLLPILWQPSMALVLALMLWFEEELPRFFTS